MASSQVSRFDAAHGVSLHAGLASHLARLPAMAGGGAGGDLALDSREVSPGDIFLALPGLQGDGRGYIEAALAAGAKAVVAEANGLDITDDRILAVDNLADYLAELTRDYYGNPGADMTLYAVTGTNGKTSVAEFVAQLLRRVGFRAGVVGTLGSRISATPEPVRNTTPDIVSITRQLSQWRRAQVSHAALEASSHALDQGRLHGLPIDIGMFTNLSRDHLDYHGTEARYAQAKLRLFKEFPLQHAVFNADDPIASKVASISHCPVLGVSLCDSLADVKLDVLSEYPLTIRLHTPFGVTVIETQLTGRFNALNLAVAVIAVVLSGIAFDDVARAAAEVLPIPGRMQIIPDQHLRLIVDYAHTPDALQVVLQSLRTGIDAASSAALWLVFGCGGDRDRGKRGLMGKVASLYADHVVVTSDNPRTEDPEAIIADIVAGMEQTEAVCINDRAEAIAWAVARAQPGDTVLVAGKGHETYQDVKGQRFDFSDAVVLEAAVRGLSS